jgi:protein-disulfide isomerase
MFRRVLLKLLQRSFLTCLLVCLGCSAQSLPPDLMVRIERQVRAYYNVPPHVKVVVGSLKASEFPNYDALTVTLEDGAKKNPVDFLLSKDQKTLIRTTRMDLTKDPYAEVMKKIDVNGRPIRGNKDAKVVAINYDDFECPFCSKMHQTLFPELLREYGDRVVFIYKDFPLAEIHPWATHAAVDANCLAVQSGDAYWDFADSLHRNQNEVNAQQGLGAQFATLDRVTSAVGQKYRLDDAKLQACVKAQNEDVVKRSIREGEALGIGATPTLFVNGQELDGALTVAEVRTALDRALEQVGSSQPAHPAEPPAPSSLSSPK